MAITAAQRAKLTAIAKERGLDLEALIKQAEEVLAAKTAPSGVAPADKPPEPAAPVSPASATSTEAEQPKLFQYHLPFVTVDEVRTKWLGLEAWGAEKGGDQNAGQFSAKMLASAQPAPAAEPELGATSTNGGGE